MPVETHTIEWVYDHLRATLGRDERAHELYTQKAKHLVALTIALFAGVSLGLGKIEWAVGTYHQVLLFSLAGLACIALLVAFLAGLSCLHIVDAPVVGVDRLMDALESESIAGLDAAKVRASLATNVAQAIIDSRSRGRERRGRGECLNRFTAVGAVLTATFIAYSLGGHALASHDPPRAELSPTMANETPNDSNGQPSPSLPLVEPSDSVQTGEPAPPPASLVEPSQLIQKSDDRSIEKRGR